ncbi:MAG: extracellular solute-binding protein [Acetatifactor sp.]|nr:extracellular solute-binding protein [Acetatifactor sp.]
MNKYKRVVFPIIIVIAAVGIIAAALGLREKTTYVEEVSKEEVEEAFELLSDSLSFATVRYQEYIAGHELTYGLNNTTSMPTDSHKETGYDGDVVELDYEEEASYIVNVEKSGMYSLGFDYRTSGSNLSDYRVALTVNGESYFEEMSMITLPLLWRDETKDFPLDRYGDQTAPGQVRVDDWQYRDLYNTSYYTAKPLYFYLESGENEIRVVNESADGLVLGQMYVNAPKQNVLPYSEYRAQNEGELINDFIEINGVDYAQKNSTSALLTSVNNPALAPHNAEYKELNTISWKKAGIEVTYDMDVAKTGYYNLALHYQNEKEDFQVFESIYIDGEIPFQELENYGFDTTDTSWTNEVLSDAEGNPFEIYLTEGHHTLTLRSEMEPVSDEWRYSRLIAEHVTQFALEIKKITGAEVDEYRTWYITRYIPDTLKYLEAYETLIKAMLYDLQNYAPNGAESAKLSELNRALGILDKLEEYPDELPLYVENLTGSSVSTDNSVLRLMGDFTTNIGTQPFALDRIYVYGNTGLPARDANFAKSFVNGTKSLIYSFTSDKYQLDNEEEAVNIWVNRAVTQVDLLQKMADAEFTPETGIKVKISVMPDANKLTLATAADETPDLALGLASHIPFELASRGAICDLTEFDDFWQVADSFAPGAFIPYVFNEGVYAVPETSDFNLIVYRKDIFEQLNIGIPSTWNDLIGILPELQRFGMNFYHNIATIDGYKWFYQTSPLIYQNGGSLYTEDGLHTAINRPEAVKGLRTLGELFSIYSVATQVPQFADSFRYGVYPIGIINLETYNLITNGAPELEGQWKLSSYLGTENENGVVDRSYIAAGTGGIIFNDSAKKDECWTFLKWWLSHDVQANYAHTLQSTYGKEYIWLPSNLEAIADCTLPTEDKQIILEQLKWLRDVPRTPGQYMLERDISNIWNSVAVDGKSCQVSIDEKILEINREIIKKMSDLGYCDTEGNLLKEYHIRDVDWIIDNIEKARKGE